MSEGSNAERIGGSRAYENDSLHANDGDDKLRVVPGGTPVLPTTVPLKCPTGLGESGYDNGSGMGRASAESSGEVRMAPGEHPIDDLDDLGCEEERQICDLPPRDPTDDTEPDPGDEEEEEEEEEKRCGACKRVSLTGRSISHPHEQLGWALSGGRGNICNECHRPWTLHLQDSVKLPCLPVHLSQRDHHATFFLEVLAYASLRKEGRQRVNGAVLQKRCDLIKWILKQMGLPSEPFVRRL